MPKIVIILLAKKEKRLSQQDVGQPSKMVLSFQRNTHAPDLAAEGWCKLRYATLNLHNLRIALLHCRDDILRHSLDGAARLTHHLARNLIYGKVVHRLFDGILRRHLAKLGCEAQLHHKAVAHPLLQVVAAVIGAELHLLKCDCIEHR